MNATATARLKTPEAAPPPPPAPPGGPKPPGKASLYAARTKPYPKAVDGRFRRLKWAALWVLLGIYYLTPFLRWDRGPGAPDQAILIDLPARRGYFFMIEIWPQEVYYITGILAMAAIGLFLVTALMGRAWCGYACPQTVWTDLYRWVEHKLEGDRNARIKLDKGPLTFNKIWRKTAKHIVWVIIGALTGGAWILYFNDAPTILPQLFTGEAGEGVYLFVGLLTFTTYTLGGIAQEQVCTYMCPWPRIQAAMLDRESLWVTYREDRGEPRGNPKKPQAEGAPALGDCIDCTLCVQVCPQGIDIRNGPQLECIQCALCVDACDSVMDKIGKPRGLIAYATEANAERRAAGQKERLKLVRPRTVIYSVVLAAIGAVMFSVLLHRGDLELNLIADRNPLYITLADGSIRNGYTLKILNKSGQPRSFEITATGLDGVQVQLGIDAAGNVVNARADSVKAERVFLVLPSGQLGKVANGEVPVTLHVKDIATGQVAEADTSFRGPKS